MTQDDLDALCREWQTTLRLADWDVKVSIERARDMRADSQGCVHWTLGKKQASIHILDPLDYGPDCAWPQDQERTLCHELLHLHFAPFAVSNEEDGSLKDLAQEQAIEALACALVKLKRKAATAPVNPRPLGPRHQPDPQTGKCVRCGATFDEMDDNLVWPCPGPTHLSPSQPGPQASIFHAYHPECGCSACQKTTAVRLADRTEGNGKVGFYGPIPGCEAAR